MGVGPPAAVAPLEDLYAGWWQLLQQLGAVRRVLVWDGEAAVGPPVIIALVTDVTWPL